MKQPKERNEDTEREARRRDLAKGQEMVRVTRVAGRLVVEVIRIGAVFAFALVSACSAPPVTSGEVDSGAPVVADDAGTDPSDAGSPFAREADAALDAEVTREEYCSGMGPAVPLERFTPGAAETEVGTPCGDRLAARTFTYALCTCEGADVRGFLTTRSFDSSGDGALLESGGPVGVNGRYGTGSYTDVGGTFTVAGQGTTEPLRAAGYVRSGGDLSVAPPVEAAGYVRAARDASFGADVALPGVLTVARDLYAEPGATLGTIPIVGGRTVRGRVEVTPPCACAPEELHDVGALVAAAREHNDNDAIGLDPGDLANVVAGGEELELPCGRFYVDAVGGIGSTRIRVSGRAALYVGGDVASLGALDIDLDEDAELDVFVAGDWAAGGAGFVGDRERPSALRVYVAGEGVIDFSGATFFAGNLYAPRAPVQSRGAFFVHGALFARSLEVDGTLTVHYDLDVLDDECRPPESPPTCNACDGSCPGSTCVDGECAPCESDADCCDPLVCYPDGSCGPLLI